MLKFCEYHSQTTEQRCAKLPNKQWDLLGKNEKGGENRLFFCRQIKVFFIFAIVQKCR